ncbi:MAG TPA: DedA family protein [Candidatus Omnitrophota bacterium]|nr:DedA family protein [Candidatus Omnitrophota bacterium]
MDFLYHCVDFLVHLDHHVSEIVVDYGAWAYLILFLIVFCETGFVVTPFLPGDSLLFVAGTIAAQGALNIEWLILLLITAAILGDSVNYWIGHLLAPRVFRHEEIRFVKKEYLRRTEKFYEKYGGKTIIIARFVPIIRTFAPFLAGVGSMRYGRFILYNVVGGVLWVVLFSLAGFYFGNIPFVKKNFSLVILVIIVISVIPAVVEYLKSRKEK